MTTLAAISLAAPLMLTGMALLALPIAAHLLHRRAARQVVFPTIALLDEAAASQSRLFKLRRLLLLLLRCLAVVLIVMGFAAPMWVDSRGEAATASDQVGVVILVDVSASTAQQVEGIAAMQSLRAAAGRTLDGLLSGADVANVVHASARPRAVFAELTANLPAVRHELDTLTPTAERADFPAALAIAGELLHNHAGPRHLVIVTDLQHRNWADVPAALAGHQPLPGDTRLTLVPLEMASAGNVGLGAPRLEPALLVAGEPGRASVAVSNHASSPRVVPVAMRLGDRDVDTATVSLEPGQTQRLSFDITLTEAGDHRLAFTIPDDALAIDNQVHLVAAVASRANVVVIGDDHPDEVGTVSYFLTRALAPHHDGRDRLVVRHVSSAEASAGHLHGAAAVVVSHVGRLSESLTRTLAEHVRDGGGLLFLAGDGPVRENLLALNEAAEGAALPWEPGPRRNVAREAARLRLTQGEWDSRLLSVFDLRSRRALGDVRFHRVWAVQREHAEARMYLRYSDGTPALGGRMLGGGMVMVANFSPALQDSDFGQYGSFVALLQRVVHELQQAVASRADPLAGYPLTLVAHTGFDRERDGLQLLGPDGRALPQTEFGAIGGTLTADLLRAPQPGFYTLMQADRTLATAAVNVDPRESDLRQMDRADLAAALEQTGVAVTMREIATDEPLLNLRGTPLWGWMLAAAMLALAVEMALLGYWRR
ncbi:MAG: BatA domain-containing protein [Phycisphaeraceae bacterium]